MKPDKVISAMVFFAISAMLIFTFILPKYQQSLQLEQAINQKQQEYSGQSLYFENMVKAVSKIESNPDSLAKIQTALPSSYSVAPIVNFLQAEGIKDGLSIKSLTFSKPFISDENQAMGIKNMDFTLALSGEYSGLKKFLTSLDTSSRLFEVNSISFATADVSQGQLGDYDFKLEVTTHTY